MRNPLIATFLLAAAAAVPAVFAQQPEVHTLSNDAIAVSRVLLNKQVSSCVAQFQESGAVINDVASTDDTGSSQSELVITGLKTLPNGRPDHLVRMSVITTHRVSEHGVSTQSSCRVDTFGLK